MMGWSSYRVRSAPAQAPVVVYGTRWCAATQMVRRYLERMGIHYAYMDIDENPRAAAKVRWVGRRWNCKSSNGICGGEVLVQPSLGELQWTLQRARVCCR